MVVSGNNDLGAILDANNGTVQIIVPYVKGQFESNENELTSPTQPQETQLGTCVIPIMQEESQNSQVMVQEHAGQEEVQETGQALAFR